VRYGLEYETSYPWSWASPNVVQIFPDRGSYPHSDTLAEGGYLFPLWLLLEARTRISCKLVLTYPPKGHRTGLLLRLGPVSTFTKVPAFLAARPFFSSPPRWNLFDPTLFFNLSSLFYLIFRPFSFLPIPSTLHSLDALASPSPSLSSLWWDNTGPRNPHFLPPTNPTVQLHSIQETLFPVKK